MTRRRLLATLAIWAVLSIALWLNGADPAVIPLAGVVAAIAATGFVAFDLGTSAQQVRWPAPTSWDSAERVDRSATPRTLRHVDMAIRSGPTELRSRLADLIDARIRAHHNVDRRANPQAVDELLTPTLRRLQNDTGRPVDDKELRTILDEIEAL